jgi:hypothetical protein
MPKAWFVRLWILYPDRVALQLLLRKDMISF